MGIGFISLTEALDMTTPTGRAMAGLLSVFSEFEREILRERVEAGIAYARSMGAKTFKNKLHFTCISGVYLKFHKLIL